MGSSVALIGAAGKMGSRLARNLAADAGYELLCCEKGDDAQAALRERGLTIADTAEATGRADAVILAVPDVAIRVVSAELVPLLKPGATVLLLDPAAAAAEEVALRDDLNYVVCHPCHPPLFGDQPAPPAAKDFFGGIAAKQDIVIALLQGSEKGFAAAEALCRRMFAPVKDAHRITVEQMAILEPAMAEVVGAMAASLMKEAMDEAIAAGVPDAAARSFMLGHAQIPLAIVFGEIDAAIADGAKIAIGFGREHLLKDNWKDVFKPEQVRAAINRMLHPESNS